MERDDKEMINTYFQLNENERIEYLMNYNTTLTSELSLFLLNIASEESNDENLRIEALKILGLYKGNYDDSKIKDGLIRIINQKNDDDYVRINAIESMVLMSASDDDAHFFYNILLSDDYILVKETAFYYIVCNKKLICFENILKKLINDEYFGESAQQALED